MIPYLNALQSFMAIFSMLPLPFRAFIVTFGVISLGLLILHILTTRT